MHACMHAVFFLCGWNSDILSVESSSTPKWPQCALPAVEPLPNLGISPQSHPGRTLPKLATLNRTFGTFHKLSQRKGHRVHKISGEMLEMVVDPPTPAYQGERAQRRLAKANKKLQNFFLNRFWMQRLTLKITPTQVKGLGRNVWHWRPPQRRSKNGRLGLARPCCFPVSRPGFWEAFSVLSPGFAGCDAQTCPNATQDASRSQCEVHLEANARCKLKPSAAKPAFFWFWTQRLTLKPLRGANWSPQLQNPLFL